MKKLHLALLSMALVFSITALPIFFTGEGMAADQAEKMQSESKAVENDDQYIIGPEDVLFIYVWKEAALTRTVMVRMDGKISIPMVDDLKAADLTPLQLKNALTEKLKNYVENPVVTVTIMEPNSFKVYVSGEVRQPGIKNIRSEMTLVKLIIMSGGFTEWADQKNILIISKQKDVEKRVVANYKKIINGEAPDIEIKRGDTVIIK